MKLSKQQNLSLRVISLFTIAIFLTFVPENLHNFFGDTLCNGTILNKETGQMEYYFHYGERHKDLVWHWGYRHWLYFSMSVILFIIQVVGIIEFIDKRGNDRH